MTEIERDASFKSEVASFKSGSESLKTRVEFYDSTLAQLISLPKPSTPITLATFPFYICFLTSFLRIADPIRIIVSFLQILSNPASLGPLSVAFKPKYQVLGKITRWSKGSYASCSTMGRNGKIYILFPKAQVCEIVQPESKIAVFDYNGEFNSSFPLNISRKYSSATMRVDQFGNLVVVDIQSAGGIILREFSEETHQNISNWSCSGTVSSKIAISKAGLIYIPRILPEDETIGTIKLCVYSHDKTLLNVSDHEFLQSGIEGGFMGIDQDENFMVAALAPDFSQVSIGPLRNRREEVFFTSDIFVDKHGDIGILQTGKLVVFGGKDGSVKEKKKIRGWWSRTRPVFLLGTGIGLLGNVEPPLIQSR